MRSWLKAQAAEFGDITRRPGAIMAVLGFLMAQMSLQADLYMPYWIADTPLAAAVFWIGLAMVMVGGVWFVIPDVRRMVTTSVEDRRVARSASAEPMSASTAD